MPTSRDVGVTAIVTPMEFVATPEFVERYEVLDNATAECVDDAIRRLLAEHRSAWARQNRVVGDDGSAWLIALRCPGSDLALYWHEGTDDSIILVLLVKK